MNRDLATAIAWLEQVHDDPATALVVIDDQERVRAWNAAAEELTGLSAAEALERPLRELMPHLRMDRRARPLTDALAGRHVHTEGLIFSPEVDVFVQPLAGASRVVGALVLGRPRSARAALLDRIHESEQRFRTMADSAPVLLWMAAPDSRCTFFNQTWLDFTGRTLEQEYGEGWAEGVFPADFHRCMDTYMAAFGARQPFEMVYRLRRHDGQYRWMLDTGVPRTGVDGRFAGYIGSLVDIHDRVEAQKELAATAMTLRRRNADLERFAYAASHDMRSPLRGIDQLCRWIEESVQDSDPELVHLVTQLRTRVGRLRANQEGLLAYARASHPQDQPQVVALGPLVRDIAQELEWDDDTTLALAPELPALEARPTSLRTVLRILLDNAATHHDAAERRVRVSARDGGGHWTISVEDDGPGIDPRWQEQVFEPFTTLLRRDEQDTVGLGLALARRVLDTVGGDIHLLSPVAEGRGTRVTVTWPRSPAEVRSP